MSTKVLTLKVLPLPAEHPHHCNLTIQNLPQISNLKVLSCLPLLVNYFLPRARVVAFWEGLKGLFRMGSKV